MLGTAIKSTIGIGIVIALLGAIDFGRQDVERVKQSVMTMLKNPAAINEQQVQELIKNTAQEFQGQATEQLKPPVKPEPVQMEQQEKKPTSREFADFYSGGNWKAEEFYR